MDIKNNVKGFFLTVASAAMLYAGGSAADLPVPRELPLQNSPEVSFEVGQNKEGGLEGKTEIVVGLPLAAHAVLDYGTRFSEGLLLEDEHLTFELHKGINFAIDTVSVYLGGLASIGRNSNRISESPGEFGYGYGGEAAFGFNSNDLAISANGAYRSVQSGEKNEQRLDAALNCLWNGFAAGLEMTIADNNETVAKRFEAEAFLRVYRNLVLGGSIGTDGPMLKFGVLTPEIRVTIGYGEHGIKAEADVKFPNH